MNTTSTSPFYMPFLVSKHDGEGGIFQGCRDWHDYKVTATKFNNRSLGLNGLVARVQGLNRWYGLIFKPGKMALVKALDQERIELASADFDWALDIEYELAIEVKDSHIKGVVNNKLVLEATDERYDSGGMGMVVTSASATVEKFKIEPVSH